MERGKEGKREENWECAHFAGPVSLLFLPFLPFLPYPMPIFLPGLTLNRRFYSEAVRPILSREFPGLAYSAALIGYGSDVLRFDTEQSTDHNWGPRLQLFLSSADFVQLRAAIDQTLRDRLPLTFLGYPVN
ncbi:MAG: hypothetical protein KDH08_20900, partial [Anaerolineae bacterium]|nr:hypothetical protein [Anaerolineae bacterium]